MKANKLPDMHYLNEALIYDESCPSYLRWKDRPRSHFNTSRGHLIFKSRSANKSAGHKTKSGDGVESYSVKITQISYPAHRVVFALVNGFDPCDKEVDHIDRNPLNNKADNLRISTRNENASNKNTPANNTSGRRGVTWCKRTKRWMAQIGFNKKTVFLGRFKNFEDAVKQRDKHELALHGEFSNVSSGSLSV